jgi:oxygen-independent coproporphyrinogen-3 oxidase
VATVFFGGGTPSLLPLPEVERIMAALRDAFTLLPDAEVSLEANPGTVDLPYLRGLHAAGVNRLSFGVQSLHDDELRALDRIHTAAEAVEGFRWAREAGFQRINLDLIYGLPSFDSPSASLRAAQDERPMERWQATLEQAIALEPDHLSLYALTVEEGTKLAYDVAQGRVPEPDPDAQAEMYEWATDRLDRAGYRQYEISNWARPGQECRHNLVYWRNGEWLGLGAGAHSHWRGNGEWEMGTAASYRFANVYSPRQYVERMARAAETDLSLPPSSLLRAMPQISLVEEQSPETAMADTAILGLRLNDGLDVPGFERRFGAALDAIYGPALADLVAIGLLEGGNGRLRLTPRGRLLANEVFVRLLPD